MKRPATLTAKQKKQLKSLAHHLDPLVRVGDKGITDGVLDAVDQALTDHELIKVKVLEDAPIDRKAAGAALAEPLDAHDIGVVGRVVILYRRHPEHPVIPLKG